MDRSVLISLTLVTVMTSTWKHTMYEMYKIHLQLIPVTMDPLLLLNRYSHWTKSEQTKLGPLTLIKPSHLCVVT